MEIVPVAIFRSPLGEKFGVPRQAGLTPALTGRIELCDAFRSPEALRGMEGFDYLWLIWGFSLNEVAAGRSRSADCGTNPGTTPGTIGPDAVPDADEVIRHRLTVRPPRLGGNVRVGVFASRSPFRPNGMGLSSVHIESVDTAAGVITVSGADLADGTPIYDIKPYLSYTDSHPDARGGYTDEVVWNKLEVVIPDDVRKKLSMPAPGSDSSESSNATTDAPVGSRTSPNAIADAPSDSQISPNATTDAPSNSQISPNATTDAPVGSRTSPNAIADAPDSSRTSPNAIADAPSDTLTSPNGYRRGLTSDDIEALTQLLSLDPRPHYQNAPDRIYGLSYAGRNIRFRVRDGVLTVLP